MAPIGNYTVYAIRASNDVTLEYRYVGISNNFESRKRSHKIQSFDPNSKAFHTPKAKWIRRHLGLIEFDVLEVCSDLETLKWSEMKWIHVLKERGHRLMNLTEGGEGTFGWVPHEEWRRKQSERMSDPAQNKYMFKPGELHPAYGTKHSELTKKKMAESKTGLKNPRCKLTPDQIREVRRLRESGVPIKEVMLKFGIAQKTVYRIHKGLRYSDI